MSDVAPSGQPLIEVRDVKKYFPIRKGILLAKQVAQVHAVDGVELHGPAGRDARPRRRVRLRQVDARADDRAPRCEPTAGEIDPSDGLPIRGATAPGQLRPARAVRCRWYSRIRTRA